MQSWSRDSYTTSVIIWVLGSSCEVGLRGPYSYLKSLSERQVSSAAGLLSFSQEEIPGDSIILRAHPQSDSQMEGPGSLFRILSAGLYRLRASGFTKTFPRSALHHV